MSQEKNSKRLKRISGFLGVFTVLLIGSLTQPAHALQLHSYPDAKIGAVETSYVANSSVNNFSALGVAESFKFGPNPGDINIFSSPSNPYFDLYASITTGGVLTGGTLNIYQDAELFLSGNLTHVDFTLGDPVLNFLFTPTGGAWQSDYGTTGGIILGASGFSAAAGFANDFGTLGANADVGTPVPEPSTVMLLLLGTGSLCLLRRRTKQA